MISPLIARRPIAKVSESFIFAAMICLGILNAHTSQAKTNAVTKQVSTGSGSGQNVDSTNAKHKTDKTEQASRATSSNERSAEVRAKSSTNHKFLLPLDLEYLGVTSSNPQDQNVVVNGPTTRSCQLVAHNGEA